MYYLICTYDLFLSVGLQNKNIFVGVGKLSQSVKCTVRKQGPECEFLAPPHKTGRGGMPLTLCSGRQITGVC